MEKEIKYDNGVYYKGEVNGYGNPDGRGFIRFPDGSTYTGEFVNNTLTGEGTYRYSNGAVYVGYLRNAVRTGKGDLTWNDGVRYVGDFRNNDPNGQGTMWFSDGTSYTGEFVNAKRNGRGKVSFSSGLSIEGTFRDDMYDGHMTFTWPEGISMEGEFHDSQFCGRGIMRYSDGAVYEGQIDIPSGYSCEGHGVLTENDGTRYEGEFYDNQKKGIFTVTYPDGHVEIQEFEKGQLVSVIARRDAHGKVMTEQSDGYRKARENNEVSAADIDADKYLTVSRTDGREYAEELQPYFRGLIGMDSVKEQLDRIYKRFKIDTMRQKLLNLPVQNPGYYFIVTGNPGTGKTTVARIIGSMMHDLGLLPKDTFVEADRSRLVGEYIGQTEKKTADAIASARGGTLFIDEAYTLYRKDSANDFGREAIDTLLKDMEDHRGEYCVILAGYSDQMNDMIRNANPGLASRFDHKVNIPDYTVDELIDILVSMALSRNFYITKEARGTIARRIEKEKIDDTFDNARYARRLLDEAIERQALRLAGDMDNVSIDELQVLNEQDFSLEEADVSDLDGCLASLNSLIGLKSVKEAVNRIVSNVRVQIESRRRGLSTSKEVGPVNMVFTGNPGTGKTTVARLLGKIYYHLGLLKRPDVFVECVRADLVGRYQGETALKVKEVVRKALGGILFIDEAYSLVMGENDSFGTEAVNTLVSEIENNRDRLAVIMAGYSGDMQKFLDSNPGLRSRMSTVIEFEDYTVDELMQIFRYDMKKRGYRLDISDNVLGQLIADRKDARDFGNARGVRNLCNEVIDRHNSLLTDRNISELSNEAIITITDEDLSDRKSSLLA